MQQMPGRDAYLDGLLACVIDFLSCISYTGTSYPDWVSSWPALIGYACPGARGDGKGDAKRLLSQHA